LKAVRFGSENSAVARQAQFFEPSFQKIPGNKALVLIHAFWLCLIATDEDMTYDLVYAHIPGHHVR
jgi:hypothetical protein